eukprot:TRINITY_DN1402_c0_g1_i1.p1 TRINITY_DN1402_c0_g1~~TRINITY_DN1402_c0_g1_i1.p1  ORF type:complete len:583 (-),score=97.52 TRINITY_DN1402_c0_g1_i1:112-1860(-)
MATKLHPSMTPAITRCPFLRLNSAQMNATYLRSFSGQCPFLGMVGVAQPHTQQHNSSQLPKFAKSKNDEKIFSDVGHAIPTVAYMPLSLGNVSSKKPTATSGEVMQRYDDKFAASIKGVKDEGRYRVFAEIERRAGHFPEAILHANGKRQPITMWCSNDYLGQGQNPVVVKAFKDAIDQNGAGAGGTRNISGTSHHHVALERELADLHQKEGALLFSSGYVANEATISTIAKLLPGMVIFSDKLNHASLISGIKSSGCEKHVFRNNDVDHLHELMKQYPKEVPKLVVFESVYSMEGSIGPLEKICDVADEHNALTLVDEVHAVGLYGQTGAGIAERDGVMDRVSIVSGTLAKGFGVGGGYIATSAPLVDAIRSFAPSFIFTTSLNPPMAAAAKASVAYLKKNNDLRVKHQERAATLKAMLRAQDLPVMPSDTHIVPVFVGDAAKCKRISDELLYKHQIYAQPINYPTVPKGEERLRLTPTPFHTDGMMTRLVSSLETVMETNGIAETRTAFAKFLIKHHGTPAARYTQASAPSAAHVLDNNDIPKKYHHHVLSRNLASLGAVIPDKCPLSASFAATAARLAH